MRREGSKFIRLTLNEAMERMVQRYGKRNEDNRNAG